MIIRWLTILMHKFDLHYAPVHGPMQDGRYQRWCQWCGLRESYSYDPRKPIPGPLDKYNDHLIFEAIKNGDIAKQSGVSSLRESSGPQKPGSGE